MGRISFQEIFIESLKGPFADLLGLKEEAIVSYYMDQSPIQDSFRYRARRLALKVVGLLIDEKGDLNLRNLARLNQHFEETPYILGPDRVGDALIYGHIRNCLQILAEKKEIWTLIRRFSPPLANKRAEKLVRETLWEEPIRVVQSMHVRKAALCAWLTLLRQSTGSCFATAPAILIQKTMPLQFFKDLYDLLSMGQLKRIVSGKEKTVPLNFGTGSSDLQRVVPNLESSPGIIIALESVGIEVSNQLREKMKAMGPLSVDQLFKTLLFQHLGLSEEDLRDEENLARIQMAPLLVRQSAVYYQRPSERAQKVADWKKKLEKASTTFLALTECALLRSWEYSIASFCDVKTEFARWNLYLGLGIHPDNKGGIGEFLYATINGYLEKCNLEIEKLSRQYNEEVEAVHGLEVMIRQSVSEQRVSQLKSELTAHNLSLNSILELRSEWVAKAESLTDFFSSLIEQYDLFLQEYFQELFDPSLLGEKAHLYEDSAAGFRLVYKHGRMDASTWTAIHTGEEYINCLREFFSNVENSIEYPPELDGDFVSEITTALIQFIQKPEFLEGAKERAQKQGRRSPWDYISGGTLQTLLMAYWNRDRPFSEQSITPHSVEEFFEFVKQVKGAEPMLMHSPNHAFILYPELMQVSRGLGQSQSPPWNEAMREYLAHKVSERLPEEERALFIHLLRTKNDPENNVQFRLNLIESIGPRVKEKETIIDSVLYEQTPLFSLDRAKELIQFILQKLRRSERIESLEGNFFGAIDLYQIVKLHLLRSSKSALCQLDWDAKITEVMQQLRIPTPCLLIFADTNWAGWFFGFVKNPTTGHLELWRVNRNATQGFPMTDWKEWLSQKNSSRWVLLSVAKEYNE